MLLERSSNELTMTVGVSSESSALLVGQHNGSCFCIDHLLLMHQKSQVFLKTWNEQVSHEGVEFHVLHKALLNDGFPICPNQH